MKNFYILFLASLFFFTNHAKPQSVELNIEELGSDITYSKLVEHGFIQTEFDNPIPPGWEFNNTGAVHIVSIKPPANPNLCGTPVEPGDFFGLFYLDENGQEKCGGCVEWNGTQPVGLMGFGDDPWTPDIKDGFATGETFIWYAYLYSRDNKILPVVPTYNPTYFSDNKYHGSSGFPGLSIVDENLEVVYPNDIFIPRGWSGMSSFTKTSLFPPIIYNVLNPISSDLIIIQDMTKVYWPGIMNNMFLWTNGKGYKIKMAEDAILPMKGCPVDSRTVSLSATWNILPVLSECNVLASTLFSPILSKIIVVKEIAGNKVFWPDMGIETLQVIEPGKAYFIAVTQNTSLTYGECSGLKSEIVPIETEMINTTPWNTPVKTGFTHTIALLSGAFIELQEGDFVGAFTQDGYCAGLVQINDLQKSIPFTIYGDDITTPEIDGVSGGGQITFKTFKTNTNEEVLINAEFDANYASSDGSFYDNGLSVVNSFKVPSAGISTVYDFVNLYPNPTNGMVEVRVENEGKYHVSIQTLNGQVIAQQNISGNTQLNLSDCSKGIYVVIIQNDNSRRIEKLIIK